jgi:hypothetical protein
MVSGADPDILVPVSHIQESRRVVDPEVFGSKMAVLAFTSSRDRSLNLLNVRSSAPSRTIAARARLYTLEYWDIRSVAFKIVDRARVRMPFVGAERITCEY